MTGAGGDPEIVLVRHPETDDNREPVRVQGHRDVPLNAAGRLHAHDLAEQVASFPRRVAALYSSPLTRSLQTAQIIGAKIGLEPVVDGRFAESFRGEWEGRTWSEIARTDPSAYADWTSARAGFRFPGGESLDEHRERVVAGLEDVRANGSLPALVICHGGTIRVALCHTHGCELDEFHRWDVPNGAVVAL